VVHNEAAVAQVLTVLAELGRTVPLDVSVVAIAPDEMAAAAAPALSAVHIPATGLGRRAVSLLMDKLAGRDVPGATLLPPALTTRRSTAPPR
jgi:LacI family transcriptional regulator, galactose operon repressor